MSFLPGLAVSFLGAGLITRGWLSYDGETVVCAACGTPAPVSAGAVCPGCARDLTELESRTLGQRVTRMPMLLTGIALLPVATAIFFI